MTAPQQPDDDRTIHLGPPATPPDDDRTVRLGPPAAPQAEETVRLGPPAVAPDDGTVRLPQAQPGPDPEGTVRLGPVAPAPHPDATVRLGVPPADPDGTVRLPLAKPAPDVEGTVRLGPVKGRPASAPVPPPYAPQSRPPQEEGFESATFLDPQVWPTPPLGTQVPATAPQPYPQPQPQPYAQPHPRPAPAAGPSDGLERFGPGVPPQAAAVWHGTAAEPPGPAPRKRRRRWMILPLVLLLAVLAWLAWDRYGRPVAVTGVSVRTDATQGPGCDGTAVITGTVRTEGGAGTVRYRWRRSDGTDSGVLTQPVPNGRRSTDVVLRWTFQGKGTMQATATLEIVGPGSGSATVAFPYTCR